MLNVRFFTALVILALVTGVHARAQSPITLVAGEHLVFDVASIKPNKSLDGLGATSTMGQRGGHVAITNFSLGMLMGVAFGFDRKRDGEIVGAPGWSDSERFDIQAAASGDPDVEEKRAMLLSLLTDRFKLAAHHEARQRPIFGLVATKPGSLGPQLRLHTDDTACQQIAAARAETSSQTLSLSPLRSPAAAAAVELENRPCGRIFGGLLQEQRDQAWAGGRRVTMQMIAESLGSLNSHPPTRARSHRHRRHV